MYLVLQAPSLKHLVLVKIMTCLWNHRHLFARIALSFHRQPIPCLHEETKEWKAFEKAVRTNIRALPLPKPIQQQLSHFIKPLGAHIIHWCIYHYNYNGHNNVQYLENFLPRRLVWTIHGTVDYVKTAKLMLKDWTVDVSKRYELACLNCLEAEARELIPFISESRRREYVDEAIGRSDFKPRLLVIYFTCVLTGKVGELSRKLCETRSFRARFSPGDSIDKWMMGAVARHDNRGVWEYFFNKLSLLEQYQVFVDFQKDGWHQRWFHNCSFVYYLQMMSEEQHEGIFRERIAEVLKCLLHWPNQCLFMAAAERGWGYMDEDACTDLLHSIVLKILDGYEGYSELFWGCWFLSSAEYREFYVVNVHYAESILIDKYEEFLKLILNEAPTGEIDRLFDTLGGVLVEDYAITNAGLKQCKKKATMMSLSDPRDEDKKLRMQLLTRLIDSVMEIRINKKKEKKLQRRRY